MSRGSTVSNKTWNKRFGIFSTKECSQNIGKLSPYLTLLHLSYPLKEVGRYWDKEGSLCHISMGRNNPAEPITFQKLARADRVINTYPNQHSSHCYTSTLLRAFQKYTRNKKSPNIRKATGLLSGRELLSLL